jgi:hypothetical protein
VEQSATPAHQEGEDENDDSFEVIENYGGPGVSRTRDLRFRKPLLYPSELRGQCDVPHYVMLVSTICLPLFSSQKARRMGQPLLGDSGSDQKR